MPTAKVSKKDALTEYIKAGVIKEYDQSVKAREEHDRKAKEKRKARRLN